MGYKLEIAKVGLYVLFPVAVFYYFNLPENQDDYLEIRKKELYPPLQEKNIPPKTLEEMRHYRELLQSKRKS